MSSLPILAAQVQRDLEALDDNGDFLPGLVAEFKQDLKRSFERVRSCHNSRDAQGFKDACHSVKSLAGHLGALHLSELGRIGMGFELADLQNEASSHWYAQLTDAGEQAVKALDAWMVQYCDSPG